MPLTKPQQEIVQAPQRFKVAICGRRFGKTTLAIREMCRIASQPEKEVFYIAPTYRQAKMIAWKKLKKKLTDLRWAKKINESELSILLKNGSTISLKGADGGAQNLRGVGLDYCVMDEFALIDEEAWYEVIRPALSDKQGHALFISTPAGMNWAHDLYMMSVENPNEWASFQFTSVQGGNIPLEEIEAAKKDLDVRTYRQEYEATFETYAGRIYYAFDRKQNVINIEDVDTSVIYVGADFNIDPMSAVVAVRKGDILYVIDEIRMFSSNTHELVAEVKSRYPNSKVWAFPDPAGAARKTASAGGVTDHTILQNAGFVVKSPRSHTPVRDRINAVNSRLCDSTGIRHLYISPKCKYTIEGLERQTYKEGTTQPDKDSGYDHQMDALGYLVDYLFPVRKDTPAYVPQRWGHRVAA